MEQYGVSLLWRNRRVSTVYQLAIYPIHGFQRW